MARSLKVLEVSRSTPLTDGPEPYGRACAGKPITFGILTTYTDEQAVLRSRKDGHNEGRKAVAACLDALRTLDAIAG